MSNEIKGIGGRRIPASNTRGPAASTGSSATGGKSVTAGNSGSPDTLSLTTTAAKLQQLEESLRSIPVVDTAHVAETRQAIVEGRYEVDPQQLADHLIQFETRLHGA